MTQMIGQLAKSNKALEFPLWVTLTETQQHFYAQTLINSRASSNFVDMQFAAHKFVHYGLEEPIPVWNADGSENQGGPIEEYIDVWIEAANPHINVMHQ